MGTNVNVRGNGVSVTFPQVTTAGLTTISPLSPNAAGAVPPGYAVNASSVAFAITTSAVFMPPVDICFSLPSVNDAFTFLNLRVLYGENGVLVDRTLSRDFANRSICVRAANLGPFLIARATANPIDSADLFVAQHYRDFLNREPDAGGLAFWKNQTTNCGNPDLLVCRVNVSAAFFLSIEFQETGFFVYRLYQAAYGDATSPGVTRTVPIIRRQEFLPDSQRVSQGVVVGVGDWPRQLETNRQAFALEFVRRQRFRNAYPSSLTPAQFVDAVNQKAGGALSPAERAQFVAELTANNTEAGRAAVLRKVADDADLRRREFNRAFVLMQYYGYLLRNPDDGPDTNFGGWNFWLSKLEEFNGDFVRAEMVRAFLDSIEYRQRFAR